jgi:hypothetical protein
MLLIMRKTALFSMVLIASLAVTGLLGACAPKTPTPLFALEKGVLAVAGFGQPSQSWEFLSDYRPEHPVRLPPELLAELDKTLQGLLADKPGWIILGPEVTRQCQELVLAERKAEAASGLCYWLEVGRCVPADYLLVPQILEWRERDGGAWGVHEPAKVVLELTLLDIGHQRIFHRYHFREAQRSLSENLLQIHQFFRRKGQWLTAQELLQEGLREGLREMGL